MVVTTVSKEAHEEKDTWTVRATLHADDNSLVAGSSEIPHGAKSYKREYIQVPLHSRGREE